MSAIVLDKKFFDNNKKFELNVIDKNGKIVTLKKQVDLFHILKSKHDFNVKEERTWAVQNGLFEKFWYDYVHPEFDQMNARGMSVPNVLNEIVTVEEYYGLNVISCIYDKECMYNVMNSLMINLKDEFNHEEFYESMLSDKKVSDKKINFVIPIAPKEVTIKNNIDKKTILQGI